MTMDNNSKYLIVGIIVVIGITGGYLGGTQKNVQDEVAMAEGIEKQCHQSTDCVDWLNENYLSKSIFTAYRTTVEVILDDISANFTSVAKAHRNLMAMVVTEETTTTTPTTAGTFQLLTDKTWKHGELITITGTLIIRSTLDATITHETDTDYIRTFNVAVFDDRSFTMPFIISSTDPLGTYTVEFKSSGKYDSISFEVIS